jgi:uncharacterized membrane protein
MKGTISKLIKLLLQIGGVILTITVVAFVRVLLQEGYRAEVYIITATVIVLFFFVWIARTWWANKKDLSDKQKKLFDRVPKSNSHIQQSAISLVIGVLFIVIIGILFYWFQVRPSNLRQECHLYAKDFAKTNYEKYKANYDVCLHSKGLE